MSAIRLVSFTTRLQMGGAENRLLYIARELRRTEYQHTVVTPWRPTPSQSAWFGPLREHFLDCGTEVKDLGLDWDQSAFSLDPRRLTRKVAHVAAIVTRLSRLLRATQADLLDLHVERAIAYGALAGRLARTPAVVATEYHLGMWSSPRWHWVGRHLVRRGIDALIADSEIRRREMQQFFRLRREQTVLVRNGLDPPDSRLTRARARSRLGLPPDGGKVIGMIAGLVPYKGQDLLVEAAPRVLREEPDSWFLFCGYARDAAYRRALEQRARELGIEARTRFVRYPGPIGDVWRAIDLHVHPSRFDSAPLTISEGMALGKPLVAAAVGGIPELVEDGVSGLLVPADDSGALASGIVRVLRDPVLLARLGAGARLRYQAHHRPQLMMAELDRVFCNLLAGRGATGEMER
jgi:glycosyltransferase involved in cell wall biosynthesis